MKICLLHRGGVTQPGLRKFLNPEDEVHEIILREDYLSEIIEWTPDIVILDFTQDSGVHDDVALVKGIQSVTRVPLFLALRRDVEAEYRERMFNSGVDGCIQAPFLREELHARLSILIRRRDALLFTGTVVRAGDVRLNMATHEVVQEGRTLDLTKTEYSILLHLLLHKYSVVHPEELNFYIRKEKEGQSSAVNVHILNIRKKMGGEGIIRTVPHYGFLVSHT
jgi:DNA-binding response OmpR family regulator